MPLYCNLLDSESVLYFSLTQFNSLLLSLTHQDRWWTDGGEDWWGLPSSHCRTGGAGLVLPTLPLNLHQILMKLPLFIRTNSQNLAALWNIFLPEWYWSEVIFAKLNSNGVMLFYELLLPGNELDKCENKLYMVFLFLQWLGLESWMCLAGSSCCPRPVGGSSKQISTPCVNRWQLFYQLIIAWNHYHFHRLSDRNAWNY